METFWGMKMNLDLDVTDIERNDVLLINGERYEVVTRVGPGRDTSVELQRLGESGYPRFYLVWDGDMQFWERDSSSGELVDVPIRQVQVLEI